MLMPKRVLHRKQMRGRMKGKAQRGNFLAYGEYGLVQRSPVGSPPIRSRPLVRR